MPGVGLDLGTMNIVSARQRDGKISTRRIRDAFIDLPRTHERMLKLSKVSFIRQEDALIIVGDSAYDMANMFGHEVRRPLQGGVVASGELDALDVLAILVKQVLGKPEMPGEICRFSVPAAPIDNPSQDVVYHTKVLEGIVKKCGYTAMPSNEALAIIFSECEDYEFSGLGMSFGSGMTNMCLALHTVEALSFSVARGGDWIDERAATNMGSTRAKICTLKEQGSLDLRDPKTREEGAIEVFYRSHIEYVLEMTIQKLRKERGHAMPPFPIPLVVSGGTSKANGFLDLFKEVFETKRKKFPVQISEVIAAKDPLNSVAMGLLIQAVQDGAEDEEEEDDDEG